MFLALDEDDEIDGWITANGARIPLKQGKLSGEAGEKITGGDAGKTFADDLEKSLSGKLPVNEPLRMGKTSEVLKLAGADDLPVVMSQSKAKEVMRADDHDISKETLLSIPKQLHDPIMVLDSSTQAGSLVVVTEVFEKGKPVVAAVHLNKRKGAMEVNEVASVYGRSGAAGFIEREIGAGKLRYINKTKSSAWGRELSGLQLPAVMQHAKRFDGKKIRTEKDIVNKQKAEDAARVNLSPSDAAILDKLRTLLARQGVAFDDQWITVKPNGPDNTGRPALIGEGGEIKAGMGGKFNGKKIGEIPRTQRFHNYQSGKPNYSDVPGGKEASQEFERAVKEIFARNIPQPEKDKAVAEVHEGLLRKMQGNAQALAPQPPAPQTSAQKQIENKNGRLFVDGKDVGAFTVKKNGNSLEIDKLYIDKDKQGKGYGTAAVKSLFDANPAVHEVTLYPGSDSHSFWMRNGVKSVDADGMYHIDRDMFQKGQYYDNGRLVTKKSAQVAARDHAIALDRATRRSIDANGFLHVSLSHISKETVNPYYGREIPGWEELGLDPDKIYQGYRSGEELAKGANTFNGLPILMGHHAESADNPQKEHRVGSTGTDAAFNAPYLDNYLSITDADAIQAIEDGRAMELSSAYRYEPVFEPGEFNGEHYDFIMTNIRGNHVALVEEGRAGPDVAVADEQIKPNPMRKIAMGIKELIAKLKEFIASAEQGGAGVAPEDLAEGQKLMADEEPENGGIPAGGAQDDEADDLGAEIFALIDGINDKELAAKIKAKIEEARLASVAPAATDEEPGEAETLLKKLEALLKGGAATDDDLDSDPAKKAEDEGPAAEEKDKAMDNDKDKEKPLTAQDAAIIRMRAKREAATETKAHIRSLTDAARSVRELCGELDPFAFDSAADIYRHALKAAGRSVTTRDAAALRDMVGMALDAKANAATPLTPAFDTREMDGAFKGLNRISIQQ